MIKQGAFRDTVRAIGYDAIDIAEREGLTLCKCTDPTEVARSGLTIDEARSVAAEDPSLVYVAWPNACVAPELNGAECGDTRITDRAVANGGAPLCADHATEWREAYGHTTVPA
jgi:hypothetical protein